MVIAVSQWPVCSMFGAHGIRGVGCWEILVKGETSVSVSGDHISVQPVSDEAPAVVTWLKCIHCSRRIARDVDRIRVNERHEHTFINPAGIIYKIGCFQAAPGVSEVGPSSSEFTWFPGHVWRCLSCANCECHLGWSFTSGVPSFFGLILTELCIDADA